MPITPFPNGISSFGVPIYGNGSQDISGSTYFVDGNSGLDSNDGSSWESAFKTLTKAMAVSHADIARGSDRWARRNTIYIAGDSFSENLTTLAQKTDIIGQGSCDHIHMASIVGTHAIGTTSYMGCRFINVRFRKVSAGAAAIMTLPTQQSGIGFFGCEFDGSDATVSTTAITATAVERLSIVGCNFIGAFSTAAISLGAGESNGLLIKDNVICGAVNGIVVNSGLTTSTRNGAIIGNSIYCSGITIDDNSDKLVIIGNNCVSDAATGDTSIDVNVRLAAGNTITDATKSGPWPRLDDT